MHFKRAERFLALLRRNAVVSLIGNGAGAFIGLVTLALLARWLPKEDFGRWTIFLTVYTLFDTVRMGLLLNGLIRHTAGVDADSDFRRWAGATWQIGLGFTFLISGAIAVLILGFPAVGQLVTDSTTVFWLISLAFVTLPANMATWFLHARSRFIPLQIIRVAAPLLFLVLFLWGRYSGAFSYEHLFRDYFIANALVSVVVAIGGWSRMRDMRFGLKKQRQSLIAFGKFSIGTLLVANLLRTSDIFLLSAFMGPAAVALYAIPQRFIQLLDTPVRSIVVTDIPRLAELHQGQHIASFVRYFQISTGRLWILLLPISLLGFVFADFLITMLGGAQYQDGALVLRLFMIQGALIPLERYSGVGLDAIGQPQANLIKVLLMLFANVVGDLVVLLYFPSVAGIAFVSIITFCVGLLAGFHLMDRYVPVSMLGSIDSGWRDLSGRIKRFSL